MQNERPDPDFLGMYMYNLDQLQIIVEQRKNNQAFDQAKHQEILKLLNVVAKNYELTIPEHWL